MHGIAVKPGECPTKRPGRCPRPCVGSVHAVAFHGTPCLCSSGEDRAGQALTALGNFTYYLVLVSRPRQCSQHA